MFSQKQQKKKAELKSEIRLAFKNCLYDNYINGSLFKENQKAVFCLMSICCGENEKMLKTKLFQTIHYSSSHTRVHLSN